MKPRIVLVEPQGPLNVGSIARVMKNFGFDSLIAVNPRCDVHSQEAFNMATHGADILREIRCVSTMAEALEGCSTVMATTAKSRQIQETMLEPDPIFNRIISQNQPSGILFGAEDRGLSNEELQWAQHWIHIPASPEFSTLNLAQSVGICCYRWFCAEQATTSDHPEEQSGQAQTLAPVTDMNHFLEHLSELLLEIGYLYPHTVEARMNKIRRMLFRAQPSPDDLALLRGMIRQTRWALDQQSQPASMEQQKNKLY
ncbi:MAG: RNA methyltransferase [SAR324 cluster bacterium]|nr:RNA methyltransferase [SAR324 cluster bacterium]